MLAIGQAQLRMRQLQCIRHAVGQIGRSNGQAGAVKVRNRFALCGNGAHTVHGARNNGNALHRVLAGLAGKARLVQITPGVAAAAVGAAVEYVIALAALQVVAAAKAQQHVIAGVAAQLVAVHLHGRAIQRAVAVDHVRKHGAVGTGAHQALRVSPLPAAHTHVHPAVVEGQVFNAHQEIGAQGVGVVRRKQVAHLQCSRFFDASGIAIKVNHDLRNLKPVKRGGIACRVRAHIAPFVGHAIGATQDQVVARAAL